MRAPCRSVVKLGLACLTTLVVSFGCSGGVGPGHAGGAGGGGGRPSDGGTSAGGAAGGGTSGSAGTGGISSVCGDGNWASDEFCEDGNTLAGDGCDARCFFEPGYFCNKQSVPACRLAVCGNGLGEYYYDANGTFLIEQCDDGNRTDGDGCTAACSIEPGWYCTRTENYGQNTCRFVACGNGVLDPGFNALGQVDPGWAWEQCDDRNQASGDGCSSTCKVEPGWACPEDAPGCHRIVCGDGIIDPLDLGIPRTSNDEQPPIEDCDDGNAESGDGCSDSCKSEPGWDCWDAGEPCTRN